MKLIIPKPFWDQIQKVYGLTDEFMDAHFMVSDSIAIDDMKILNRINMRIANDHRANAAQTKEPRP